MKQIFKTHYGKDTDQWSLARWIPALGQNVNKLWDKSNSQIKDFNSCSDFFDIVLNGCLVGALSAFLYPNNESTQQFIAELGIMSKDRLKKAVEELTAHLSDFNFIHKRRGIGGERNQGQENLFLFMQQALMLRNLILAMRQGDSGRVLNSLSYFTVWFQATKSKKYAKETLRLTACIRRLWSEELKVFWMQNCLINMSGKREGFIALDMFNEYIVREVKNLMSDNVTEETDEYLRDVLSPLVMIFWESRRKMAEETESNIFDFHSSPVDSWIEILKIANWNMKGRLYPWSDGAGQKQSDSFKAPDIFIQGLITLSGTIPITKLKNTLLDGSDCNSFEEEEDDDTDDDSEASELDGDHEWEDTELDLE